MNITRDVEQKRARCTEANVAIVEGKAKASPKRHLRSWISSADGAPRDGVVAF